MGTNYYIGCHDGSHAETTKTHIGKNSGGWVFDFQGDVCKTVAEWKTRLEALPGECVIVDEYGGIHERHAFWHMVEGSKLPLKGREPRTMRSYALEEGSESPVGRSIAWRTLEGTNWIDEGFSFSSYEFC
jgi:hypothetical protein